MSVPSMPISLMFFVYKKILPEVHRELAKWKRKAESIPNTELRNQALASIDTKTFHCEGGAILALIAKENYKEAIKFIVAYQTISDYLDNLCDRSNSLDPQDFASLHESMKDAISGRHSQQNYYQHREDRNDGGYLEELVATCNEVLLNIRNYSIISKSLMDLCQFYTELQIHKHVHLDERVPRLKKWFDGHKDSIPTMEWFEFSACSGSTLGIFCLVSYAMREDFTEEHGKAIRDGYFPYIQGLHILLDYLIDQEEDLAGGDLNFCFYYENEERLFERLKHFINQADEYTVNLPHKRFHQLINRGLLGIYLSDEKVRRQGKLKQLAKEVIRCGGKTSYFFYLNGRAYRHLQKYMPVGLIKGILK